MLTREIDQLNLKLKAQEEALNKEISSSSNQIENLRDMFKFYKAEYEAASNENTKIKEIIEILRLQVIGKCGEDSEEIKLTPSAFSQLLSYQDLKNEKNFSDIDKSFHSILTEKDDLRKSLQEKEQTLQDLSEECFKLNQQLHELKENEKKQKDLSGARISDNTSNSFPSENSSGNSYMSLQEMLIIENISEIDVRKNPLLNIVNKLKKEPPMVYSNV